MHSFVFRHREQLASLYRPAVETAPEAASSEPRETEAVVPAHTVLRPFVPTPSY